jgi:hypothetical protein
VPNKARKPIDWLNAVPEEDENNFTNDQIGMWAAGLESMLNDHLMRTTEQSIQIPRLTILAIMRQASAVARTMEKRRTF